MSSISLQCILAQSCTAQLILLSSSGLAQSYLFPSLLACSGKHSTVQPKIPSSQSCTQALNDAHAAHVMQSLSGCLCNGQRWLEHQQGAKPTFMSPQASVAARHAIPSCM